MDNRQPNPSSPDPHDHPAAHDHPVVPDLALLEAYLDGELQPAELAALQQRLGADAELSAALARLSDEYTVRQAVYASLEGTPTDGERLARAVLRSARRATAWDRARRYLRAGAVAAACVVCFAAGWAGRGSPATASVPGPADGTSPEPASFDPAAPAGVAPLVYQVALTDADGNITAVQKFDSLDEARNFAADVGRWQARQAEAQQQAHPVLMQSGL